MSNTISAICASNLELTIGGSKILTDINCEIKEGQSVAIVGPNGAGKSSFLRCIINIAIPTGGSLKIYGTESRLLKGKSLARLVSYLPQDLPIHIPFTLFDFVLTGRFPYQCGMRAVSQEDLEATQQAISQVAMEKFRDRIIGTLSAGEKQKALIANCLAQGAKVLLLDEPTSYLDPINQIEVLELINSIRKSLQLTVLWVTHDLNLAAINADRIIGIKAGRTILDASPKIFMTERNITTLYDRHFLLVKHPRTEISLLCPEILA